MATLVEGVKPFKVRASCGHIEVRKMREATAGVPFTEDTVLEAPNGRACAECENKNALFIGCFPTGFSYADKRREVGGDWLRVAVLPYSTLELIVMDPKSDLLPAIREHAAGIVAKRGERYQIAGNMSITLGGAAQ